MPERLALIRHEELAPECAWRADEPIARRAGLSDAVMRDRQKRQHPLSTQDDAPLLA